MSSPVRIRRAEEADLDALTTLILTSFRQFQLFAYLYSSLQSSPASASDTLWYWRRRLHLEMLDPYTDVLVADIGVEDKSPDAGDDMGAKYLHEWMATRMDRKDPQIQKNVRKPYQEETITTKPTAIPKRAKQSWTAWLKDQDPQAYAEYINAEGRLAGDCYSSEVVYYLDNLTVDFRFQRRGIGKELVQRGLEEATRINLPAMTEASLKGEGLYYRLGFEKIAVWDVCGFKLPVMRWMQSTEASY
ncbi:unnamed protein product [Fusarium graminearum]|uniref:Uncharacterized protein n=1 Tax=Gibberella zeae TaxID=5518 RepID=A0A2H3GAV7_GIBZA|nr:hypothetical protein HG531_013576 [Fusarium graminearum]PCD24064.1 hypothetical protein FGRA07_11419 [Fusarium graminearum]CAF3444562.1 unnamed protein product [Fusarium graminearum]CAG1959604.1 unnamed protein product [Fusarium graminearum]CAG2000723.1 unnamed protein product [Fusarium graminearum]